MSDTASTSKADTPADQLKAIKETLIGITIAFTLAFVFRGFIIEGFVIPTGSMAPTLLGKHIRVNNPDTGNSWNVGPWLPPGGAGNPPADQGEILVTDPMSNKEIVRANQRIRWGDRVFVLKYLPGVNEPERWDVTVFKNPSTQENYIKRMVGLPNEQLALVDGDAFTRAYTGDKDTAPRGIDAWELSDWTIQRKPERVQRELWNGVHDTQHAVRRPSPNESLPWVADGAGANDWRGLRGESIDGTIRLAGDAGTLSWDSTGWPIDDWNAYNETRLAALGFARDRSRTIVDSQGRTLAMPVSDIALTLVIEADSGAGAVVTPTLRTRGFEFRAVVGDGQARLKRRDIETNDGAAFETIDEGKGVTFSPGVPARVEFWHADQALWLFVDGDLVAGGPTDGGYELSPAERLTRATIRSSAELPPPLADPTPMQAEHRAELGRLAPYDARALAASRTRGIAANAPTVLGDPALYRRAELAISVEGGPVTLHRVRLDRDLHYQVHPVLATRATHPDFFPTLGPDQFFMCGDNSSASLDSRLWRRGGPTTGEPDPWISEYVEEELGVAHRRLLLGRAFVVYFPAPYRVGPIPVPDLGKVRWIW